MTDNNKDFDDFVDKLQKEIMQKEIEDFNEYIVKLCHDPPNWGRPLNNNVTISHSGLDQHKNLVEFFLWIEGKKIIKANFITDGCGVTVAVASQITLLIEGKTLEYSNSLTVDDIDKALHGLSEDHKKHADLIINILKELILKYRDSR
ncbi:MAG: iron-sulfur cluster assembly scaffold protein [Candidatus Heimdallarchaeota archaeon]